VSEEVKVTVTTVERAGGGNGFLVDGICPHQLLLLKFGRTWKCYAEFDIGKTLVAQMAEQVLTQKVDKPKRKRKKKHGD